MATLVLAAAGAAIGGAAGGAVLGVSAAVIGQAAGAIVGGLIDQAILGPGQQAVSRGKASSLRIQGANEGAPIPRIYGRMRVAGHVIWSTRFHEHASRSGGGGKGSGPTVTDHSYTISFATALCEGPIDGIGRVWADGKPLGMDKLHWRLHSGGEDQGPDPLIEAVEGWAPAYRGTAYLVFEDLDVGRFGNRAPQISVEVLRAPRIPAVGSTPEAGLDLAQIVRGVALSPGTGEFVYATERVQVIEDEGKSRVANVNTSAGKADALVALDQLEEQLPAARAVSLVVSWFGSDLRCGRCTMRPGVEYRETETAPAAWSAGGADRASARLVGRDGQDRPVFGGTPSDASVIALIAEMNDRGLEVMFYPFLLMDVGPGNGLPDPWGWNAEQSVYPWRGRITTDAAPGQPGSSDMTAGAADEVAAFFGAAAVSDFAVAGGAVVYSGPEEWSLRRMVLHYAHLCKAAGGVHAFCIGSEFRALTQIRSGRTAYPAVEAFRTLAADVRAVLGAGVKLSYAADWSEYFGHQPQDGTGDRIFHLDPLWAHPAVDFIGIDYYAPLTDWRDGYDHLDAAMARSIYDLDYLSSRFAAGEGYDWYYASDNEREAQIRTPIIDGAHGEDWIWRSKDILNWWRRPHHDRIDGVRVAQPSAWTPQMKPIWLTEIGCGAVDKGANQPNVFIDPKSSESALPHFSSGQQDDLMQRRMLQAAAKHWGDAANNPISQIYGQAMLDLSRVYVWTWDARPWPEFPAQTEIWSDGANHALGHWLTGRVNSGSLAAVVAEICAAAGLMAFDVGDLDGVVDGFAQGQVQTAREALQSLMLGFGFDAVESGGVLTFRMRGRAPVAQIDDAEMLAPEAGSDRVLELTRSAASEAPAKVRVGFVRANGDYQDGVEEAASSDEAARAVMGSDLPIAMSRGAARAIAQRWLRETDAARERARFAVSSALLALEPGDVVRLPDAGGGDFRIDRITDGAGRMIEATRIDGALYALKVLPGEDGAAAPASSGDAVGPPGYRLMDVPWVLFGGSADTAFAAVWSDPWPGSVSVWSSDRDDGYERAALTAAETSVGRLLDPLPRSDPWKWSRTGSVRVRMLSGSLASADEIAVYNGANLCALSTVDGRWEMLQFRDAVLEPDGSWRLSRFSRGLAGTEPLIADPAPAGSTLVMLDALVVRLELPDGVEGLERHFRIVPSGADLSDESVAHAIWTWEASGRRPLAPVHLAAVDAASGDVAVSWIRRSRIDNDSFFAGAAPLGEVSERYRVRLHDAAGALVREVETTAPEWTYAAADKAADGLTGLITFAVAQVSESYGPGFEGKAIYSA
jgi:hypothetical protein